MSPTTPTTPPALRRPLVAILRHAAAAAVAETIPDPSQAAQARHELDCLLTLYATGRIDPVRKLAQPRRRRWMLPPPDTAVPLTGACSHLEAPACGYPDAMTP